jgi:hypothetical protein
MKEDELNRLLEKYYNGESTEEEERTLKDFFTNSDSLKGYETEKKIFGFFNEESNIPELSPDFEKKLLGEIDSYERTTKLFTKKRFIYSVFSAAAALLFAVSSYFFLFNKEKNVDTYSDPKIAYNETVRILFTISSQLNRGNKALKPIGKMHTISDNCIKTINKPTAIAEKKLKNLNHLQDALNLVKASNEETKSK